MEITYRSKRIKEKNLKKHTKVKRDRLHLRGVVVEAARGGLFKVKVELDSGESYVLATPSGKIQQNLLKILPGDSVVIEVCLYDLTRGRIVERVRNS